MKIELIGGRADGTFVEIVDDERLEFVTIPSTTGRTVWRPYFGTGPVVPYPEFRTAKYRVDRLAGTGTFVASENL